MSFLSTRKYLLIGLLSVSLAGPACIDTGEENQDTNQDTNQDNDPIDENATELSGPISENQTWSGDIRVTGDVSIRDGAEITIEAGTRFFVDADVHIEFGWNSNAYSLFANGTEEAPIVFQGSTEEAGFWRGITLGANGTSNSNLTFVEVHHAGGGQAAVTQNAELTVSDLTVNASGDVGLQASNFRRDSETLTVTESADTPVVLTNEKALANFPYGGDLTGNASDQLVLDFSSVNMEVNIQDPGVPFYLPKGLSTRAGTEFTVPAGILFLVGVDQSIEFGWNANETTFDLQGTEEAPIIFEGIDPAPGSWSSFLVRGNVTTNSNLNHVVVRHAGNNDNAGVKIQSAIGIQNLSVEEAFHTGFSLSAEGLRGGSENINIRNTQGRAALIDFNAIGSMPSGTYEGNDENFIDLINDLRVDATIKPLGAPFRVIENLTTREGAEVIIEPGTHFFFAADRSLEFGWNANDGTVQAVGTSENPIVFTGEIEEAGSWEGVIVGTNITSNSTIEFAEFNYATTALELRTSINVENCTFANYEELAIDADNAADVAGLLANNTFDDSGINNVAE